MDLRELNGKIVKKVLMVVGVNSHLGRKSQIIIFLLGKTLINLKYLKLKNSLVSPVDHINILSGIVRKTKGWIIRLNVNKVSTEGTELEDGTVADRVDLLDKVIPRRAIEDKLSKLVKTSISVDGKLVHALVDSGTELLLSKKI
ncbi:hypothetical protein TNIN_1541 [Trichonephila inaurata madagascariensis]|uniref:Uncharacterized protein n=1 Tax=Trichonephila inaurata madagascariensis TaxID=2747483 RepID=A0A8X6XBB3_9ARAC|nr:hypothetical protein TNIN_1541 [Trichonephila inaurata madagascariensis]